MNAPQQPFPGQPYPPAPQPPQKKSKKWPWIVGAIAAVVVIGAVSGGGDDEKKTATTPAPAEVAAVDGAAAAAPAAPAASAPAPKKAAVPGMGTPVRDGKFEFVVTDVESGLSTVGDNPFLTEKAQGQFVIVTMTVQNTADKPKGLSPSDQEMYDTQGRKFTANTMAAIALDSDVSVWDEINPGNKVTMKVVYDMPADAVPAEIELHDSMFSGGTRVALQ